MSGEKHNNGMACTPEQTTLYDYDCDDYDSYDDFGIQSWGGSGRGGARVQKRTEKRGGSQGSGSVYSSKHTRLRETRSNGSSGKKCQSLNKYKMEKG
mmetsp:Transcript_4059/g.6099  ORF Transcript_4059/g.6099 Transcript_4059/m.6099 type:complete len:97 (-) Transcript_4059:580-870(-)